MCGLRRPTVYIPEPTIDRRDGVIASSPRTITTGEAEVSRSCPAAGSHRHGRAPRAGHCRCYAVARLGVNL
jgi:hypothetical protein